MKQIQYVQRSRKPGARLPPNTRCCTRPGKWSNPFEIGYHEYGGNGKWWSPAEVVNLYTQNIGVLAHGRNLRLADLAGYDFLSCWCAVGDPCHVQDVLIPMVNKYLSDIDAAKDEIKAEHQS